MLDFITWTADPAIFSIGSREIRWYGLAFAIGFWIGYSIVSRKTSSCMDRFPADLYHGGYCGRRPSGTLPLL